MASKPTVSTSEPEQWTAQKILSQLSFTDSIFADFDRAELTKNSISSADKLSAERLLQTTEFHKWMFGKSSGKLLVHGAFKSAQAKTSPFTHPVFVLAEGLTSRANVIILVFFCGFRLGRNYPKYAHEMIRSLLKQLLEQWDNNGKSFFGEHYRFDNVIETSNTQSLVLLFESIVKSLPGDTTVFCMIDGVDQYENEAHIGDMTTISASLLGLACKGSSPLFKTLFTSAQPTEKLKNMFKEKGDIIDVPSFPDKVTPTGHVIAQMDRYFGDKVVERVEGAGEGQMDTSA